MPKADIIVEGKRYSIACASGQEERLHSLGNRLDRRIKSIKEAVGDIGEARLLLVAALALIDELDAAKLQSSTPAEAETRASAVLLDAAARIDAIVDRIEAAQ